MDYRLFSRIGSFKKDAVRVRGPACVHLEEQLMAMVVRMLVRARGRSWRG